MEKIKNICELAKLVSKKITNELSDLEQKHLDSSAEKIGVDINKYKDPDFLSQFNKSSDSKDSQFAYDKLIKKINKRKKSNILLRITTVAATLLVPVIIYYAAHQNIEQIPVVIEDTLTLASVSIDVPDNSALLLLADGSEIKIGSEDSKNIEIKKSEIKIGGKAIRQDVQEMEIKYHTLKTPKGGEYYMVLEDGTKVWINADSKIEFPSQFEDDKRYVKVTGELFFDVVKDENRPFIVELNNTIIEVLGTSFNVRNYVNEEQSSITLVEGSVNVDVNNEHILLKPNERLIIGYNETKVQTVDVEIYTNWIKSLLTYKNNTLKYIMNDLERLYDIDVEFENKDMEDITFTGSFNKYDEINKILNILSFTGNVKFKQEDKKVIIQ